MKRVYELDPLRCRCGAELRFVSLILDPRVIQRILTWLDRWPPPVRPPRPPPKPPPRASQLSLLDVEREAPPPTEDVSQLPHWWDDPAVYDQTPPRSDD